MKPYKLKLKDVRRKAQAAYKAGLLTAQSPFEAERVCVYLQDGTDRERCCAIGAALPKKLRQTIAESQYNGGKVYALEEQGFIAFASARGSHAIARIQSRHDTWCAHAGMKWGHEYEAAFKQEIGL